MRRLSTLLQSFSVLICGGLPVSADEMFDAAQIAAATCPEEWATLAQAAPDEIAIYRLGAIHPEWDRAQTAAMGRLQLMANVVAANQGAVVATISFTKHDQAWQDALVEYDMGYEWGRGRGRATLVNCLLTAIQNDRDLALSAGRAAYPDVPDGAIEAEIDHGFSGLEAARCYAQVSVEIFALDFDQPDLAADVRDVFAVMLPDCQG